MNGVVAEIRTGSAAGSGVVSAGRQGGRGDLMRGKRPPDKLKRLNTYTSFERLEKNRMTSFV